MKKILITLIAAVSLFTTASLLAEHAHKPSRNIHIMKPWVRAAPTSATVQAGFFILMNHSDKDMILTSAKAEGFGHSELHLSSKKNGVMIMEEQSKIIIPANSTLNFKPGSYHIMLMKPTKIAQEGEEVKITLGFLNGESVTVMMPVKRDTRKMAMDHSKMDHSKMDHATPDKMHNGMHNN